MHLFHQKLPDLITTEQVRFHRSATPLTFLSTSTPMLLQRVRAALPRFAAAGVAIAAPLAYAVDSHLHGNALCEKRPEEKVTRNRQLVRTMTDAYGSYGETFKKLLDNGKRVQFKQGE